VRLSVYGEKRQKTKLICLQYATLHSTTTLVLLFEIYQIPPSMVPNQIIRETPIEAFESLYGGQFTLSTQLTKPNYHKS